MNSKTFMAKKTDVKHGWYLVDAQDKILGRLASKIAFVLSGKRKPAYTPHIDAGDNVVVINAARIRVSGSKLRNKVYRRYSGYPGGLREINLEGMLSKNPAQVLRHAVRGMLPKNSLGREMIRRLRVYTDGNFKEKGIKMEEKIG
ncbi:MAG: 50S ribosomal protein L13 [Candidatus Omnitrophota bacterium]